jgi:sulfite reductase (ferredoxin)
MACPALPTCGLALAESERSLPGIIDELEPMLVKLGLEREEISLRMTGCPNGCSRPYLAELAFVGRSPETYTLFVGGKPEGTRLNVLLADKVHRGELAPLVGKILVHFKENRLSGERLGDYCLRNMAALSKLTAPEQ